MSVFSMLQLKDDLPALTARENADVTMALRALEKRGGPLLPALLREWARRLDAKNRPSKPAVMAART